MIEWSKALFKYTAWTLESLGQLLLGACLYVQGHSWVGEGVRMVRTPKAAEFKGLH